MEGVNDALRLIAKTLDVMMRMHKGETIQAEEFESSIDNLKQAIDKLAESSST